EKRHRKNGLLPDRLQLVRLHGSFLHQSVSSMYQTGGSTTIICNMPPGKTSLVVISRSLWECHMKTIPDSSMGFCVAIPGGRGVGPRERRAASGPRYGVPLYHKPLVTIKGSNCVAGPPLPT